MSSKLSFFAAATLAVFICGPLVTRVNAQVQILPGQVLISEVRLAGIGALAPVNPEDEYVEIYNNTNNPIVVQATDTTPGWAVAVSFGQTTGNLFIIPNGTVIPARGHFLGANSNGYSLAGYPSGNPVAPAPNGTSPFAPTTPNATWNFDIPENNSTVGLALFTTTNIPSQGLVNRLDAFGMVDAAALFHEGAGFPTAPLTRTLVRDMRTPAGFSKDTDNNATDFLLLSDGGQGGTVGPGELLGAPGPENLNSPVTGIFLVKASLLDPALPNSSSPNRERRPNFEPNANLGTLLIRRKITNNSNAMISRLRFRAIDVTGPGSDNTCGAAPCADVRVLTSFDGEAGSPNIGIVTVRGLTLEQPPNQPNGGGFNSSLSADFITLATPLAPGASVNVEFKLGIMRTGSFRLLGNFEAQAVQPPPPLPGAKRRAK